MHNNTNKKQISVDILDDEQEILTSLQDYMGDNFFVNCFSDSEVLLAKYKLGRTADILICDIHMPKMNGHKVIRKIRKAGFNLPIIMISGFAEKPDLITALSAQVDAFIEKPFSLGELESLVIDQYSIHEKYIAANKRAEKLKHMRTYYQYLLKRIGFVDSRDSRKKSAKYQEI